ncbi:hypothetical protein HU200_065766 [Digitaria exilis]|uniref:Cation-transporting P-type ATPase N-terminal domain-containing protein n=1 Tax=Digitaria exilis TaxID=1010633 RepID=A0A834ZZF1_9POAL|nr:hypothetical protein HU200_065766 [Digitaria exilis]
MAQGTSPPPPEIRSPDERGGAEDGAEAEVEEEVFDDAFDIPHKNAPHDRLRRWRQAALVLNASRRFRYTLDLKKEEEKEIIRRKIRSHAQVIRVLCHLPAEISYSLVAVSFSYSKFVFFRQHFFSKKLAKKISEVKGLSDLLKSNLDKGVTTNEDELLQRRNIYGANTYPRKKRKNILRFVFEACQDLTLAILMVAAAISLTLGMTTEGPDEGWYDGGSIFLAVFLVILVTAISDYRQSLQFRHLNEEKQNIQVEVVRGGKRSAASIFDLVVGDVVPLNMLMRVDSDEGVHVHWKGAAEIVLSSCNSWLSVDGSVQPMSAEKHDEYKKSIENMAANSLRCVAFAYCDYDTEMIPKEDITNWKLPEDDLTLLGIVGIKDPCRPGVRDAVRLCTTAGVKVRMVTGDNIETAKAIALECGILDANGLISEPVVIEGKVFREMSETARVDAADKIIVMGRSSPNDKLLLVQALKRRGHVVAVTGDGTNDAPALHEADIGLSMGISGTEVAKESSDIIILDDDFTSVVKVVRWGRSVYANIQKFIQFQLTVNVAALVINVVAAVSSGDVPLNAALYQVAILLIFDFAGVRILRLQNESRDKAERMKNTFIFNTFVFCQIFNEFNARKPEERNVFKGVTKNHLFMGIIGITTVFQVLIIQFLGKFFKTVRLDWRLWLVSVAIGIIRFQGNSRLGTYKLPTKPARSTGQDHLRYMAGRFVFQKFSSEMPRSTSLLGSHVPAARASVAVTRTAPGRVLIRNISPVFTVAY